MKNKTLNTHINHMKNKLEQLAKKDLDNGDKYFFTIKELQNSLISIEASINKDLK